MLSTVGTSIYFEIKPWTIFQWSFPHQFLIRQAAKASGGPSVVLGRRNTAQLNNLSSRQDGQLFTPVKRTPSANALQDSCLKTSFKKTCLLFEMGTQLLMFQGIC